MGGKHWLLFPQHSRWLAWGLLLGTLALLAYSCYRAATFSLTFDECWSYQDYAKASWADLWAYSKPTANHHLLNSILMKLSLNTFGLSEFSLRLPNVLAHAVYLWFVLRILRHLPQGWLMVVGFVLLNLDPYVLDFFSLARGYGLALAATMASLSGLATYLQSARLRHLSASLAWAVVAVLANFSLLHFFLALLLVLAVATAWQTRQRHSKAKESLSFFGVRAAVAIALSIVLTLLIQAPIRQLLGQAQFYYGGKEGIWADTLTRFAYNFIYRIDYWKYDVMAIKILLASLFLLMPLVYWLAARKSEDQTRDNPGLFFFLLLLLPAFSSSAQHHLTGANYLHDRTALFFHPLFHIALLYLLYTLQQLRWSRKFRSLPLIVASTFACLYLLNANHSLNLSHSLEWRYDACTKSMLQDLQALHDSNPKDKVKLGISWQFRLSINFYRERYQIDWLQPVTAKGCEGDYDYYYVLGKGKGCRLPKDQLPFWEQENKEALFHYPVCDSRLGREKPLKMSISKKSVRDVPSGTPKWNHR